ncbi:MAG: hypothetical protein M0027_11905 [Candidatus Dormibacteraeota bacterium]|nr:hypothetical protein [Candidatus Dormibacteraeota bacterium]
MLKFNPDVSVIALGEHDAWNLLRRSEDACQPPQLTTLRLPEPVADEIGLFKGSKRGEAAVAVKDDELVVIVRDYQKRLNRVEPVVRNVSAECEELGPLGLGQLLERVALAVWFRR